MLLPLFKTLHIVGFVAWFAGLFYLVRMFVYHAEAMGKPQPERDILTRQFNLMQWRVYRIICTPAMNLTWAFGTGMLVVHGWEWFTVNSWLHLKLVLLFLLSGYHYTCKSIIQKLEKGETPYTSFQFRLLNEVPTMFLLAIVLLAVYRNSLNALYTMVGMLIFGFLLFGGAKWYRRTR
jgi:putative membrane protein